MSVWLLTNIDRITRWVALLFIFSAAALITNFEIKDLDIWLHLASGKYILEHKIVPQVDFLSCSISGQPWVNHEWLFQVIIAELYKFFGAEGWISLQGLLVGMTVTLLLLLCSHQESKLFLAWLMFAVVRVFEFRILLRPDAFSLMFYLMYLTVIFKFIRSQKSPWLLFILQILWTNIHGFFILGPLTLFIIVFSEWLRRSANIYWIQRTSSWMGDVEYAQLKKSLILVVLACFINPFFIDGVLYPIKVLFQTEAHEAFFAKISELQKPLSWNSLFVMDDFIWYKVLIFVSGLSFVLNRKRINLSVLIIWCLMLIFSLKAVRNLLFFSTTAVFVTAYNLKQFLPRTVVFVRWVDTSKWFIISIVLHLFLIGEVKTYIDQKSLAGYYDFDNNERKSEFGDVSLRNYPYRAVDFLVKEKIKGNFINDFNSGAYLLGRTFPDIKVYIDGRTEVYGLKLFNEYDAIIHGDKKLLDQEVQRCGITGAFLNSVYTPLSVDYMRHIYFDPEWKLVYFDYDAMIFLRNIPKNKKWIDQFSFSLDNWNVPKADLLKFGIYPIEPYQYYRRAQVLYNLKFYEKAKEELIEALRISPNYALSYKLISRIYYEEGSYDLAFENARKAKVLNASDYEVRYYLAASAFYLGDRELAKTQSQKILAANVKHVQTLYLLATIYFKENDAQKALFYLEKAIEQDGEKSYDDVEEIIEFLIRENQKDSVGKIYEMIRKRNAKSNKDQYDVSFIESKLNQM